MAKTDERVLGFFVSGALLAGSAACTKNSSDAKSNANNQEHVNEGPQNEKPVEKPVNEGSTDLPKKIDAPTPTDLSEEVTVEDRTNTNRVNPDEVPPQVLQQVPKPPMPSPMKRPDRVNTNHIGPNGENLNPQGVPERPRPPQPDRTNTNRQIEPGLPPVTKP